MNLDLIIVATVTPDMSFPSTACVLQGRLGARMQLHLIYQRLARALFMA